MGSQQSTTAGVFGGFALVGEDGRTKTHRPKEKRRSSSTNSLDGSLSLSKQDQSFLDFRAKYSITSEVLGKGRFGKVRRVTNRATGCNFAVKAAQTSSDTNCELLKMEASILQELTHENIIKPVDIYSADSRVYVVLPLCQGGSLSNLLVERLESGSRLQLLESAALISQLLAAVSHFHQHGISHRDIKTSNILLSKSGEGRVSSLKVSDFGLARRFDSSSPEAYMRTMAGTPSFMAPEVIRRRYREKADVWSCGVVCYLLIYGKLPFSGKSSSEIMRNVKKGNRSSQLSDAFSCGVLCPEARVFVNELLQPDPARRLSAQDALEHNWLVKMSQNTITNISKAAVDLGAQEGTKKLSPSVRAMKEKA